MSERVRGADGVVSVGVGNSIGNDSGKTDSPGEPIKRPVWPAVKLLPGAETAGDRRIGARYDVTSGPAADFGSEEHRTVAPIGHDVGALLRHNFGRFHFAGY